MQPSSFVPVLEVGGHRLTFLLPNPMSPDQTRAQGEAIVRARLGDISIEGLTLSDAANRLAEHVERIGAAPDLVTAFYARVGATSWLPSEAAQLVTDLRGAHDEITAFQMRAAVAGIMWAALQSPGGPALLGILGFCDAVLDVLGRPNPLGDGVQQ